MANVTMGLRDAALAVKNGTMSFKEALVASCEGIATKVEYNALVEAVREVMYLSYEGEEDITEIPVDDDRAILTNAAREEAAVRKAKELERLIAEQEVEEATEAKEDCMPGLGVTKGTAMSLSLEEWEELADDLKTDETIYTDGLYQIGFEVCKGLGKPKAVLSTDVLVDIFKGYKLPQTFKELKKEFWNLMCRRSDIRKEMSKAEWVVDIMKAKQTVEQRAQMDIAVNATDIYVMQSEMSMMEFHLWGVQKEVDAYNEKRHSTTKASFKRMLERFSERYESIEEHLAYDMAAFIGLYGNWNYLKVPATMEGVDKDGNPIKVPHKELVRNVNYVTSHGGRCITFKATKDEKFLLTTLKGKTTKKVDWAPIRALFMARAFGGIYGVMPTWGSSDAATQIWKQFGELVYSTWKGIETDELVKGTIPMADLSPEIVEFSPRTPTTVCYDGYTESTRETEISDEVAETIWMAMANRIFDKAMEVTTSK